MAIIQTICIWRRLVQMPPLMPSTKLVEGKGRQCVGLVPRGALQLPILFHHHANKIEGVVQSPGTPFSLSLPPPLPRQCAAFSRVAFLHAGRFYLCDVYGFLRIYARIIGRSRLSRRRRSRRQASVHQARKRTAMIPKPSLVQNPYSVSIMVFKDNINVSFD
jgi:hypothetical protein